ncbi:MAG: DNA repair protein RecN [Lachnospiraceae bacterium]|nr:DNA repair protein RecN [Lachnospiraceae bacterium]
MLTHLHVKNLAIVEDIEIDFGKRLNILTGETGVGKSVIVGSINIALGAKISSDMIRTDEDYALVEMIFEIDEYERRLLEELAVYPEDGMLIISRKIMGKRSVSKINGETVTLNMLKRTAGKLIDIHGQHEHQSLLYKENHLAIIDRYARDITDRLKDEISSLYLEYIRVKKEYDKLHVSEEERGREAAFLEFEKNEIEQADIGDNEEEELEKLYKKLNHAEKTASAVGKAYEYTSGGADNAAAMISSALGILGEAADYDESVAGYVSMLADVETILSDVNHELSSYIDNFNFDGQLYAETEERLDFVRKILAKYGGNKESLDRHYEKVMERYRVLSDYERHMEELAARLASVQAELDDASRRLSEARKKAAGQLSGFIEKALGELSFAGVKFEVAFEKLQTYSAGGIDEAEFLISTNPGEPIKPLAKVASGGELSRIMLAIKSVLADKDSIHSLVFDEIDTGISGRTAQRVSEKLAVIAGSHQVICITHLAQIAAMADNHYVIEKKQSGGRTSTDIRLLDESGTYNELARIIGGTQITEAVKASAGEMKKLAADWKRKTHANPND